MGFFESLFFFFGILTLVHCISLVWRLIVSHVGKPVNAKEEFTTEWALITGANAGTGRLIAIELAKQGINIIGTGRDEVRLASVKKEVEDLGVKFESVSVDLANQDSTKIIMDALGDRDVGICILNAGFAIFGEFEKYSEDELKSYIETMCTSSNLLIRAFLLRNKDRKNKSLIYIIASLAAQAIWPHGQMYNSVKAYISAFTKHAALEAKRYSNVQVQAIHPSFFRGSNFFNKLPSYVSTLFGKAPIFQTSEDVTAAVMRSLGRSDMCDTSLSSCIIRCFYWIMGIPGINFIIKIYLKLIPKQGHT